MRLALLVAVLIFVVAPVAWLAGDLVESLTLPLVGRQVAFVFGLMTTWLVYYLSVRLFRWRSHSK